MVTLLKTQETTEKKISRPSQRLGGKPRKSSAAAKTHSANTQEQGADLVQDTAFKEPVSHPAGGRRRPIGAVKKSSLMDKGKDLISGEAGSVATAAAVVVGAALIEVELIPGIIIGAAAILLGKFFPEVGDYVRPAIKGAMRAGYSMAQKAREVVAEASEQVHDLVAEVKHEQEHPLSAKQRPLAKRSVLASDKPVN